MRLRKVVGLILSRWAAPLRPWITPWVWARTQVRLASLCQYVCIYKPPLGAYTVSMEFEWDEAKNARNRSKHGVSFEEAQEIFMRPTVCGEDTRREYGEQRYVSIGELRGPPTVVLVVVHTRRGDKTRLISARKATRKERNAYHACLKATTEGTGSDA